MRMFNVGYFPDVQLKEPTTKGDLSKGKGHCAVCDESWNTGFDRHRNSAKHKKEAKKWNPPREEIESLAAAD